MRPELGRMMPLMRFSSVVLPEPFGPKMPRISCSPIWKDTSETATSPPKRRVRFCTSSSTAQGREGAKETARQQQDGQDQDRAVKHGARLARQVDQVRQPGQHEGPDDGTCHRTASAQQYHGNDVERLVDAQISRLDVPGIESIEATGERRQKIGKQE